MPNPCTYCSLDATTLKTNSVPACAGHGDPPAPPTPEAATAEAIATAEHTLLACLAGMRSARERLADDFEFYPQARLILRDLLTAPGLTAPDLEKGIKAALREMGEDL